MVVVISFLICSRYKRAHATSRHVFEVKAVLKEISPIPTLIPMPEYVPFIEDISLVVMAPKNLSTKHKNQTNPRRSETQTKDPRKTNMKEQRVKRQAAPNPGEHATGVRLQGGGCASTLGGVRSRG